MSNEEMDKRMEFVIEQQAQFAGDLKAMREIQAEDGNLLKEQYGKLSEAVITVVGLVGKITQAQLRADDRSNVLMQAQARTDDRINALAQTQTRTDERINQIADSLNLLTQAEARTEERLNIFINVVERHISGNGGSENRV